MGRLVLLSKFRLKRLGLVPKNSTSPQFLNPLYPQTLRIYALGGGQPSPLLGGGWACWLQLSTLLARPPGWRGPYPKQTRDLLPTTVLSTGAYVGFYASANPEPAARASCRWATSKRLQDFAAPIPWFCIVF